MPHTVTSFADERKLRPHFTALCFAFSPGTGLARARWEHVAAGLSDEASQAGSCSDALHPVFLHLCVFSTLVVKHVAWHRVRLLPPEHSYARHLLDRKAL